MKAYKQPNFTVATLLSEDILTESGMIVGGDGGNETTPGYGDIHTGSGDDGFLQ